MFETEPSELFRLLDESIAKLSVKGASPPKPIAVYGITPTRYHKLERHVLDRLDSARRELLIVDIRQIYSEKDSALKRVQQAEEFAQSIDELEGEFIDDVYDTDDLFDEDEEYGEYGEYDEYDELHWYDEFTNSDRGRTRPQQPIHYHELETRVNSWHSFAENTHCRYALAHDSNYEHHLPMSHGFETHVCRVLLEKYQWSLLCIEPGYEYWQRQLAGRTDQIVCDHFHILDLSMGFSPIERRLKEVLDSQKVAYIHQYEIQTDTGIYRADFLINGGRINLIVECDGNEWHTSREAIDHDRRRQREIESQGFRVLRFTGKQIWNDLGNCVATIKRAMWQNSP